VSLKVQLLSTITVFYLVEVFEYETNVIVD